MQMPKKIQIIYYALLRQERGLSEENLETQAETAQELYQELQQRYNFKLEHAQLKVAINSKVASWTSSLKSGDVLLFIPPVAGG